MECPGFDKLLDYCDGYLTGREAQLVADHLSQGCRGCADGAAWYRRVRVVAASDDTYDPPPWVFKRALQLFDAQTRPRTDRFSRLSSLVFDSLARPAPTGVRSMETSNRQLLYRAGVYSIDLQISFPKQSGADLIGQILRESESRFESVAGLAIQMTRKGQKIYATITNEVGEFTLNDIAQNQYDLSVETNEGIIVIPRLPVTPH